MVSGISCSSFGCQKLTLKLMEPKRKRNIIALVIFVFISLSFTGGGSYITYWQSSGEQVIAKVTYCTQKRRSEYCTGFWFVDDKAITGHIENATSDDVGNKIEVRALGEHAIKPNLGLPFTLFGFGLLFALMGWQWWKKELKTTNFK